MDKITLEPIGIINTPYNCIDQVPRSTQKGLGARGKVVIDEKYVEGLADLEGFSHIVLVFHLHLAPEYSLKIVPPGETEQRGLFATRSSLRPNPIGVSVVRLRKVESNVLYIENVDMLDGTPLLDIKPYTPYFEKIEDIKIGWLSERPM